MKQQGQILGFQQTVKSAGAFNNNTPSLLSCQVMNPGIVGRATSQLAVASE